MSKCDGYTVTRSGKFAALVSAVVGLFTGLVYGVGTHRVLLRRLVGLTMYSCTWALTAETGKQGVGACYVVGAC